MKTQFCTAAGVPVASGRLYTFLAGTSTPHPTYSDVGRTIENPNPIVLNAAGQSPTNLYFLPVGYKLRLDDADDVPLWTADDIEPAMLVE